MPFTGIAGYEKFRKDITVLEEMGEGSQEKSLLVAGQNKQDETFLSFQRMFLVLSEYRV